MLAKRVIPCLDVDRGRVVKGTNFVNLRDAGDPVEVASRYEKEGADELVFLDITASHEGRDIMLDVVRRTAEQIFMPLTVGGGIRTLDDIRQLLLAGYDLEITAAVSEAISIPVVASGGAGKPEHLADAITIGKADAALAASIFHFGEYTIEETKRVMADRGIPVRWAV